MELSLNGVLHAIFRRVRRAPFQFGLQFFYPGAYLSYIPDRFYINLEKYRKTNHVVGADYTAKFVANNQPNNAGDIVRYYFLSLTIDQVLKEKIPGDIAELGVYRGNSAAMFAELARKTGKTLYLFDTFEGFKSQDLIGIDSRHGRNFEDTSLDLVKNAVGTDNVVFVKGWFPDSLTQIDQNAASYAIAHIDCDLYAPFKSALEYFYPRVAPGGFLILHDYSSYAWDGAERAVDEFFADKPESVVLIPDKSGTAVVRKAK